MATFALNLQPATIPVPGAPAIPGLRFRHFAGPTDFPAMVEITNRSAAADGVERVTSLLEMSNFYSHPVNCDPERDLILAEVSRNPVGYARVNWREERDGLRLYFHWAALLPEWRRRGIGAALLRACQRRLREMAAELPPAAASALTSHVAEGELGANALLRMDGYRPARYSYLMVRPTLEMIPELPLPDGLEVRPARPEHYHRVFEANEEAFQDHWGFIPRTEEDCERWLGEPATSPGLWQVAWEGDEIAGMVLSFINTEENLAFRRRRGYTEDVCVRRPWRRRGLARALLARSLALLRERGMTEAALGVDTENPSGALQLYESLGYRPVQSWTLYRKPVETM
jgi:ribosomal protein S18 acetylase RimI-like enzyme